MFFHFETLSLRTGPPQRETTSNLPPLDLQLGYLSGDPTLYIIYCDLNKAYTLFICAIFVIFLSDLV